MDREAGQIWPLLQSPMVGEVWVGEMKLRGTKRLNVGMHALSMPVGVCVCVQGQVFSGERVVLSGVSQRKE